MLLKDATSQVGLMGNSVYTVWGLCKKTTSDFFSPKKYKATKLGFPLYLRVKLKKGSHSLGKKTTKRRLPLYLGDETARESSHSTWGQGLSPFLGIKQLERGSQFTWR